MRYVEYIYLGVAVMLLIFFALKYEHFNTLNTAGLLTAIGICSFMYSFRRQQRLKMEEAEKERLKELESIIGDEDESD